MSSYLKMIQAVSGKYNDKVKRTTSSLFHYFNLNSFWYNRVSDSGTIATLASHIEWTEYFGGQEMYLKYPCLRHSNSIQAGVRLFQNTDHMPLASILHACKNKYDMHFLFSIVNKTKDGIEEFGFASASPSGSQISMLFNELPLLRLFARKFKEENHCLLTKLEENQINLVELLGAGFYEQSLPIKRFEDKELFLRDIRVEGVRLTQAEKEVVRLILNGHSASQIGESLFRSSRTIEHRLEQIKLKLSCESKAQLIQKARELERLGLLDQSCYSDQTGK